MSKAQCLIVTPTLRAGGAERTLINLLQWLGADADAIVLVIGTPGGALESEVPACVRQIYLFRNPDSYTKCDTPVQKVGELRE